MDGPHRPGERRGADVGVTRRRKTYVITIEDYDNLEVTMSGVTYGELTDIRSQGRAVEVIETLAAHILSWDLVDEDGAPVPTDADGLGSLDLDDILGIYRAYLKAVTGQGQSEEDPLELPMSARVPA